MNISPKLSLLAVFALLFSFRSFALVAPSSTPEPTAKENKAVSPLSRLTVDDFLALTPKKIREMTGQKMSLKEKIALKITQSKLKREIRNNPQLRESAAPELVDDSDFNLGGFVLGLIPVIGLLIAYLIGDRDVIKWAWIGFGLVVIIFLLTLIF